MQVVLQLVLASTLVPVDIPILPVMVQMDIVVHMEEHQASILSAAHVEQHCHQLTVVRQV